MTEETLTASVLRKNGDWSIPQTLLDSLPELQVLAQAVDPAAFMSQTRGPAPDLALADLDGEEVIPPWLAVFIKSFPQTAVMICSNNRKPEFLIQGMQAGVREFLPSPLTRMDLEAALDRLRALRRRVAAEGVRSQVLVVTGQKGGVGITTVAVNLATALAGMLPRKVALVDLGRPFADVAEFLNQDPAHNLQDLAQNIQGIDHSFLLGTVAWHQDNLAVLHGFPDPEELRPLKPDGLEKLFALLRPLFEWVVVDLSPWFDDLYRQTLAEADQVLLLTELSIPDLRNLSRLWLLFKKWDLETDKIKIVVNRQVKGLEVRTRDLEELLHQPVFATLPSDYFALMDAINSGTLLGTAAPRSRLARGVARLAREVVELRRQEEGPVQKKKRRFLFF